MSKRFKVVLSEPTHIAPNAGNMRTSDIVEVDAACNQTPYTALLKSFDDSEEYCRTILWDGVPAGMFGVGTKGEEYNFGRPWFLADNRFPEWRFGLLKITKGAIQEMLQLRRVLHNFVHAEHLESIEWLKWAGFIVEENTPLMTRRGHIFYHFSQVREDGYA